MPAVLATATCRAKCPASEVGWTWRDGACALLDAFVKGPAEKIRGNFEEKKTGWIGERGEMQGIAIKEECRRQAAGETKQGFEWLEVLGRGVSGVCRKVRGKDGKIMVVKQIDISFVTPEEYESATR